MPPPSLMQQVQQQQQRPRFEHPQPGQAMLGRGGGIGGLGAEKPRMPGNREEFFDPKRMRRF